MARLKVYADDNVIGPGIADDAGAYAGSRISRNDVLQALFGVVVNDLRRAHGPSMSGIHPHPRLCFDIAHVVRRGVRAR